jgi:zinc transport system substrate-binding protein
MIQAKQVLRRLTLVAITTVAIASGSCTTNPETTNPETTGNSEATQEETTEELQVVTTFLPITQFTKAVAGDRAEVTQLLPINVGPHDYQAKPTDVQAIAQADVLVQNGLEFEVFLEDLIDNAENSDLAIVDSSQSITTLSSEEHSEKDDHHEEHHHGEHHHHGEFDPHIWLDPKRAIAQVENIRDGLIAADPEGKDEYSANAKEFIEKLQALDAEIAAKLQPYTGQTFIIFHDFALYFAESYGLEVEFLVDIPEENPSPKDVQRIIETVKAGNLKALLTEPQIGGENAFDTIAEDLQVTISEFDPLEAGDINAIEPQFYLTTMRQNAENLAAAFGTE